MISRKKTKKIFVGDIPIGGDSKITVQSMTNTITKDTESTINQIHRLENVGCDIIRFAVNDLDDAKAIRIIKENINIPTIADIQFDYKLAVAAAENHVDALRINPGNIGAKHKIKEVVNTCKYYNIPIRVGVNSGSVKQEFLDKYHGVNENSICYSALEEVELLESMGFFNIKVSLKASNVNLSIASYEKFSSLSDYPLHLGITESGPTFSGTVKSAVGIGSLLSRGIGDTIRVSLTTDPIEEIKVGREILKSLDILNEGVEIISCPTCSRTKINLIDLVNEAELKLQSIDKNIKVALMGCPVNGPGEAKEADIGIAGGNGIGIIFKKGKVVKKVKEEDLLEELFKEIEEM
ncbi:4-hydroxy-3-methylbut-2-en-1-yl diphosphate synthase [Anaerosphaera aminiphila DSM 21120]|uniref:4-hydroxy-3-methylbut-2-en-1-yl diphosphate synthase (flavodoxin) n=1 Tax=Anaerosphaera aminiphila DSM 21120 TaxID=1120995 RepID=A0A1M5NZS6_9FIRM|nr:flavodoxin-dependent (E)-4-hydroxy-3-methylbut-2-enyl-diphosphate synthase [Anaerosphaera aminiphila]SHG95022.1 4-hydroxy-3-methylbut-2-en-1-yl diphosphate synthase [Anaerosphaera aminiphila DSM 21120]